VWYLTLTLITVYTAPIAPHRWALFYAHVHNRLSHLSRATRFPVWSPRASLHAFASGYLGISTALSAPLQDGLLFLPIPLPPEEFGVACAPLTARVSDRPHGPCLVPSITHFIECVGVPTSAVALGTASEQFGSAHSGYLPFGSSVPECFACFKSRGLYGIHWCSPCTL